MRKATRPANTAPLAAGTGLVTLDVVFTEGSARSIRRWAGGTCANVLLALRYLGWRSAPVARLREGDAATRVIDDLQRWGVSTEFVTIGDDGSTPVIVHRIGRTDSGEPYHRFSWRCPNCGARLPGFKPVLASAARELIDRLERPQVFFFDRASRSALLLARACAERGAAVMFEPSSVGNPALFREAWGLAHVVKHSSARLREVPTDVETAEGTRLQIETLGRNGLRYRSRLPGCRTRTWQRLEALTAQEVKDTAGAGDWCTAGIVDKLLQSGAAGLGTVNDASLRQAMRYGQALAAWNCGFEGARGGMYSMGKRVFESQVIQILNGRHPTHTPRARDQAATPSLLTGLCSSCEERETRSSKLNRNGLPVRTPVAPPPQSAKACVAPRDVPDEC